MVLLFAYLSGERSSRRIERLCVEHVGYRIACGQDAPDHTTLARFRAGHDAAFVDLFAQVLALCAAQGMVKVGSVAIDGTKIAANASRGANRTTDWVREQAEQMAADIVAEAAATDAAEDAQMRADNLTTGGGSGGVRDVPAAWADPTSRKANIAKAIGELERRDAVNAVADAADAAAAQAFVAETAAGRAQPGRPPSGVDPVRYQQARIVRERQRLTDLDGVHGARAAAQRRDARRILDQAEHALVDAQTATAAGQVDLRGPAARARDRREAINRGRGGAGDVINITDPDSRLMTDGADGGSVQAYNAQATVTDDHIILAVTLSQDANDKHCYKPALADAQHHCALLGKTIGLTLLDNGYFTQDNLTHPGPDRLIAPGKNRDLHAAARDNPTTGPPPPDLDPKDQMRHRLRNPDDITRYKRRGATIETTFGTLKETLNFRRFTRRGLPAVTAELHLGATAHNLLRLHTNRHAT